ncbi:MAG: sugar ABC transporter permease [Bacillota bacterium]|nr:MAG: sugar ABC transporter permease [Bacillota bacterium]
MLARIWRWVDRHRLELALVVPMAIYVFGLTLWPVCQAIFWGFSNHAGELTLENYRELFGDSRFLSAFLNTLFIVVVGTFAELCFGLFLAWCLARNFKLRGLVRSLLLVPMGVPTLVSAINFMYIFDNSGYLNELLIKTGLATQPINWASGGLRTLMMVVAADMWKVTPSVMLILLAGLEAIPEQLYEAAAVDGATPWQTFRRVVLPLLKPAITTAVIIRGIDAFRIFELPLVLAGRNTPFLATFAFDEYMTYHNQYTSGAASTVLLVLILVFAVLYLKAAQEGDDLA